MARLAAVEHRASWVVHADADELWWPAVGNIPAALTACPRASVACGPRARTPPPARPSTRSGHAFGSGIFVENSLGQPLPPKLCHRGAADVILHPGNHHRDLGDARYPRSTARRSMSSTIRHGRGRSSSARSRRGCAPSGRASRVARGSGDHLASPGGRRRAGRLRPWWEAQVAVGERADGVRYVRDDRRLPIPRRRVRPPHRDDAEEREGGGQRRRADQSPHCRTAWSPGDGRHARHQRRALVDAGAATIAPARRDHGGDAGVGGAQLRPARLDAAERRHDEVQTRPPPRANQESFERVTISSAPCAHRRRAPAWARRRRSR